jgi:hypothetical protein
MLSSNGIIIILSYPDTVVRPAYWEPSSKIWPKIGVGSKHAVQAGHAALLLIKKNTPEINYFDFGRYITSYGNGRVRSKETDAELKIPLKAEFKNGTLSNLKDILLWIEKHPEKTHGQGRLITAINSEINFIKAKKFITNLIEKKEMPYGAFIKNGSNCARFVTDTLINAGTNKKSTTRLKNSNYFTPSPIGNVIKGNSDNKIYGVLDQQVSNYLNRSILKEYKASFFNKFNVEPNLIGTENPNLAIFNLENGTWLGGIGSGAWFNIEAQTAPRTYKIGRYDSIGKKNFEGVFILNDVGFEHQKEHQFLYPTNCNEAYIKQHNQIYSFLKI